MTNFAFDQYFIFRGLLEECKGVSQSSFFIFCGTGDTVNSSICNECDTLYILTVVNIGK